MFGGIFSWFKSVFSYVAETIIGKAVEEMADTAREIVGKLEQDPDLSGKEKYTHAKQALEDRYPSARSAAINLAIETAVAIVKDRLDG